jgi:hemerythrin
MTDSVAATATAVDHDEVDREHRLQLDLLIEFRSAAEAGTEPVRLEEILDRLVDFTKIHFAAEQTLMRTYSFRAYEQHVLQHEDTLDRIEALREACRSGEARLTRERLDALTAWIVEHIRQADAAFARHLETVGGRRPDDAKARSDAASAAPGRR